MTNIEIIRAAAIEANPEIVSDPEWNGKDGRTIRLADVLLAIGGEKGQMEGLCVNTLGQMSVMKNENNRVTRTSDVFEWNLRLDDLTQQCQKTITFLSDLLK